MPKKPEAPLVGGRRRYTLSSYEPVAITVTVPLVSADEVELGLAALLRDCGWTGAGTPTDAWVRAHVSGFSSLEDLRDEARAQLTDAAKQYADHSRRGLCLDELASRLGQSVPEAEIAQARRSLLESLESQTERSGLTLADALRGMGVDRASLDSMLDAQAQAEVEHEAALDAYADDTGLRVDETELPARLCLSPVETQRLIRESRANGTLGDVMRHALRAKAEDHIVSTCVCTYRQESPEESRKRREAMLERHSEWMTPDTHESDDPHDDGPHGGSRPHLRLV